MRGIPKHVLDGLAAVPLFSGLSQKELRAVAGLGTGVRVEPGDLLTREGTSGIQASLIASGKARCVAGATRLQTLGPGDFFGEMSLLDGAPRSASVVAETSMQVTVFNRREFVQLVEVSPRIVMKLLTTMARRLRTVDERVVHG